MQDKDNHNRGTQPFSTPEAGSRSNALHIVCNIHVSESLLEGCTFIEHCHVFRTVLVIDVIYQKEFFQASPSCDHMGIIPSTL